MGLAVSVGLLDVFVRHVDAISAQGSASAGLDLALGVPLLYLRLYDAPRGLLASGGLQRQLGLLAHQRGRGTHRG
jgi:hypothetical protein